MSIGDRLKLGVGGLVAGVLCGLAGALLVCAFGGMVLPKLHPELAALASVDVYMWLAFVPAAVGLLAGLTGPWALSAFCGLALAAPLGMFFATVGMFAGPFLGGLLRVAAFGFGLSDDSSLSYAEHDVLVGCEVGIALGALSAVRLMLWPPAWMPGAR